MRRPTLSTKMFIASLPMVLAVAALLALTVRTDLRSVQQAENTAELGRVWEPLINAVGALENEVADANAALSAVEARRAYIDAADGVAGNLGAPEADAAERAAAAEYDATNPTPTTADLGLARSASDAALDDLLTAIDRLDGAESAITSVTEARSSVLAGRRLVDRAVLAPDMLGTEMNGVDGSPSAAYDRAGRDVVAIGELLPSEAGDPELGSGLLALLKLARARLAAGEVIANLDTWQADPQDRGALAAVRLSFEELENHLAEFEVVAPEEWLLEYRNSGFASTLAGYRTELNRAAEAVGRGETPSFDTDGFAELVRSGVGFQTQVAQSIVTQAEAQVTEVRAASFRRILVTLGVVVFAIIVAWVISRSITRRVKAVARGANSVAADQLPALVEALQDPRGNAVLPEIEPVVAKGNDEVTELAEAFNSMQHTLVDVAREQVEVLRRGVSDIFVTMARRNRSLIDRQLAMLDRFEAEVEDSETLAHYYQLDHLATRMRRNSESLLVLANAEPKRKRVKPTEIDDVVRASIGEVEEYRRIEIETLEPLVVSGNAVADISHLLAELLDNATSFSPPDSTVRVGGRLAGDHYVLRIVDDGVGIGTERLTELNELLREPPLVGLSVESTLGMSVVSLLANKHEIQVTLAAGYPGLTVDVLLPSSVFGPSADSPYVSPYEMTPPVLATAVPGDGTVAAHTEPDPYTAAPSPEPTYAEPTYAEPTYTEPIHEEPVSPVAGEPAYESAPISATQSDGDDRPDEFGDDRPRTVAGDFSKMALDLSAFRSGMASAVTSDPAPPAPAPPAAAHVPSSGPRSEFDRPLAPPVGTAPMSQRPVAPEDALAAPTPTVPATPIAPPPTISPDAAPDRLLPTRAPGAESPDGGFDRLDPANSVGALESALSRADPSSQVDAHADRDDTPTGEADRLDPVALRDRLRAFQTEFRSGNDHDADDHEHATAHGDLGGDR